MSIYAFSNRIGVRSDPPDTMAQAVRSAIRIALISLAAGMVLGVSPATAQMQEKVSPVFQHPLPNVQGKKMVAVVVNYPPGAKSSSHHHAASAFIYAYVLSGAIRSQVGDQPEKVYRTGEGFYEMPGAHHKVSENASDKEPASLLAIFVVDAEDKALTTPDQEPKKSP
jgi:quercetin dioxygenase-like cupin family protein